MKKTLYSILFTFCIIYCKDSFAQSKSKIVQLEYGIYLKKLVPDFKENKFYAEFYWWIKFKNDSSKSGFTNDEVMNLEYVNAVEASKNAFEEEVQEKRELDSTTFYYTGYHQGYFFFNPNFLLYPFDKQEFTIQIEHTLLLNDQILINPDIESYKISKIQSGLFGLSSELVKSEISGMKILKSEFKPETSNYNSNFGDPEFPPVSNYSRLTYSVNLDRIVTPYITKLFIPLGIILFLVYFVFFIPAEKLDMAAGLTVTSLLSAIAFQFTVNESLPQIGYLIYVDKVFYLSYFLIVIAMGQSLITFYLDNTGETKKKNLVLRLDYLFRIIFPLIFFGALFFLLKF